MNLRKRVCNKVLKSSFNINRGTYTRIISYTLNTKAYTTMVQQELLLEFPIFLCGFASSLSSRCSKSCCSNFQFFSAALQAPYHQGDGSSKICHRPQNLSCKTTADVGIGKDMNAA
ncbi:hypothetical protein D8674_018224 [Pyrus ussuriensis x Pyrus communis]|uniref:Uncharacterized protein n=1 Tax=Pyrus ussuriensis x Pyrus communis TaxID=2448454 RepID=A0A5N5G9T7_9ROSA|nr:hypothetical protein D8674_018224 [Pyrus ussuriensis x Pyrus communis]